MISGKVLIKANVAKIKNLPFPKGFFVFLNRPVDLILTVKYKI